MSTPTAFTVHPAPRAEPTFGVCTPGDSDQCTSDDLASAANPLHYVPFVSQVYEAVSGDSGSSAMKIIGGALLGGPLGLVAGLASAVFEQATGASVGSAIASVFSGEEAPVQTAQASTAYQTASHEALAPAQEILPPEKPAAISAAQAAEIGQNASMRMASAITDIGTDDAEDSAVLALFGGQSPSAHQSYRKAQMLPYLRDVNSSMVM